MDVDEICMVRRPTTRRIVATRTVCENVSGLLENILRAHDDDSRVPVLNNRHGQQRPFFDPGSQARRLTVFSSFLFPCRPVRSDSQKTPTSSSWRRQVLCALGDSRSRSPKTAQLILASLLAVATITTLRAALVSNPPIHVPRVEPWRFDT